jgi:membrane protein YqaA with SNARE-associated domain
VPDFLLDVQKPEASEKDTAFIVVLIIIVSAMIGGVIGWLVGRKHKNNKLLRD